MPRPCSPGSAVSAVLATTWPAGAVAWRIATVPPTPTTRPTEAATRAIAARLRRRTDRRGVLPAAVDGASAGVAGSGPNGALGLAAGRSGETGEVARGRTPTSVAGARAGGPLIPAAIRDHSSGRGSVSSVSACPPPVPRETTRTSASSS